MNASLADLLPGSAAKVVSIGCDRPIARRLMEMGLLPGTRIRIVRIAPLGDPIELRVRDYALSIRRSDAARIVVMRATT
ncbi:MAG: FeoA family protein [Polyangiales bacterium]